MQIYFAPMEGITGYVFRNVFDACFPGADRYFTPFIAANHTHSYKSKEGKDISPQNNGVRQLVPQVLTNKSEDFLWAAQSLAGKGYREINLNLGCPSPTVVSKKKGSGFLGDPDMLDRFFDEVFAGWDSVKTESGCPQLSVKTRIGVTDTSEAARLMTIFNRYPISELIIHPRLQCELYRGTPHRDVFLDMMQESRHPVCYNGDICKREDLDDLLRDTAKIPDGNPDTLRAVMIGRGFLKDPALIRKLSGGGGADAAELRSFHDRLLEAYTQELSPKDALFRMKELWAYLRDRFEGEEKRLKKILKSGNQEEYLVAVDAIFTEGRLKTT